MTRFITVTVGCDYGDCTTVGPEGEGIVEEMTLAVDKKSARTFGICKKHREDLNEILTPLLARGVTEKTDKTEKATRSRATQPSAAGPLTEDEAHKADEICLVTVDGERCNRPFRNRAGLAQHTTKQHGMTLAEHDELAASLQEAT